MSTPENTGGRAMLSNLGHGVGAAIRATAVPVTLGMRWVRHTSANEKPHIPTPQWNLGLLGKVMLDDFFYVTELASASIVSLSNRQRLAREISESVEFHAKRGWDKDPSAFHREPGAPRMVKDSKRSTILGSFRELSFKSGYAPHRGEPGRARWLSYEENHVAHIRLMQHRGPQRPWLVCVPGYRMGHPIVDLAGFKARWIHEELGLNVAIPVMPLHGPRSRGVRGGDGFLSGDFVDTLHAQTQAVWDTRRLIRWLRARGAPSVSVYGISLGGYTASLLASLEDDLDTVIAGVPVVDFIGLLRSHMPDFVVKIAERLDFPFETMERMLRVISPLAMSPRVAWERRFIFAATADSLAVPEQARELWRHWEKPRLEWYHGSHVSFIWEPVVKSIVREALAGSGLIEAKMSAAS